MTLPGLETTIAATHPLAKAARTHVHRLRDSGIITDAHELQVQLVLHLADRLATARGYTLANISKELREALAELPSEQTGDKWDQLIAAILGDDDQEADQ